MKNKNLPNKCPKCKNCVKASSSVHYNTGEGFDPVTIAPKKYVKSYEWEDTYTCIFGVKDCPQIQKCSHYTEKLKEGENGD